MSSFSQRIQSSCGAVDSITKKYRNDANQLALRNIYRNELGSIDSVRVPKSYSDTLLRGLLAIYNLDSLKERDTIFDYHDIRAREAVSMTSIYMKVDSSENWVKNIKDSVYPVGEPMIDRFFEDYKMKVDSYYPLYQSKNVMLTFKCVDTTLNMSPIVKQLKPLSKISWACTNNQWSSGYDIHDSVHADHVEYVFSIRGFTPGDVSHYFMFNVFFDCSVEFKGRFIRSQPHWVYNRRETYRTCISNDQVGFHELTTANGSILVFPNPATNELTLSSNGGRNYSIFSISGQKFQEGIINSEREIISIDNLQKGTYFIRIYSKNFIISKKFVKQ